MMQTRTTRKSQKAQRVATLKDVADAAGVSTATASRAINNLSNVKEVVRERVMSVAASLNYNPNLGARSLALSRTNTVAFLLPAISGEFVADLIRGVDEAARRVGMHMLLSGGSDSPDRTERAVKALTGRADGFLILAPHGDSATFAKTLPTGTVYVSFSGEAATDTKTCLIADHFEAGRVATRHLIFNGCRRIAYLGGDENAFEIIEHARGYLTVMDSLGLAANLTMNLVSEDEGGRALKSLLDDNETPDGIVASHDAIALGAMAALKAEGLRVPEDVAVIGYGNFLSEATPRPELSTMGFDAYQIGKQAFYSLLSRLTPWDKKIPGAAESTPRLIERASTRRQQGAGR